MPPDFRWDLAVSVLEGLLFFAIPFLVLALAIEVPVAALMGLRRRRDVAAVACVSLMTNVVAVWAVLSATNLEPPLISNNLFFWIVFGLLKVVAAFVAARLLAWALNVPSGRMIRVAAAMNAASFAVMALLFGLGPALLWP